MQLNYTVASKPHTKVRNTRYLLLRERVTKTGSNRDHSQLAYNEIKSDNEGFSTIIRLCPEGAEYNDSSVLATVTNEDINTSKKRKRKTKKRQYRK